MKSLVIVESPTKARTIGKFLGNDYVIKASMGHVVDLPKSTLAIDIKHDFKPLYEQVLEKKQIIAEIKTAAKSADSIILATDPDREGEAIAAHIADILTIENRKSKVGAESRKLKIEKNKINPPASTLKDLSSTVYHLPSITRIVFHEITKEAIEEALKNPREIDRNLVDAQTARRVLDRLVGYKLSPLLWKKVRRGLSAGRVQSVALRLIVEREREIEKFGKEKYWTISAFLSRQPRVSDDARLANPKSLLDSASLSESRPPSDHQPTFNSSESGLPPQNSTEFELVEINGEKIEIQKTFDLYDGQYKVTKTSIDSAKKAEEIVADLKTKTFTVSEVLQKETKRSPTPPYTTSTLQQDAARRLGINGKRTMSLAQKLYEEGYITYHRTDSITIGSAAMSAIINFAKKEYGEKYVPAEPRFYSAKQKLAQEAHEAIRPTKAFVLGSEVSANLGGAYGKLYDLIWKRAVASQMSDAIVESTTVFVDASSYKLKANGSVLVFDGFLKVNPLGLSDNRLPKFSAKQNLDLINVFEKGHETLPPPRYNDASIIKTLEEKGIGRPSTYATIISTIESRSYIERQEGKFFPTAIGTAVNDFLVTNFSDIDDIPFTAKIEDELDYIANGEKKWVPMMKNFYSPFERKLKEVEGAERVKIAVEETSEKCPLCGKANLIIRTGKFGKFLACPKFPDCKFTKPYVEETGLRCPKCGSPASAEASIFANASTSANASADRSEDKGGQIVIKKTRKGRKFYGCSNYPKCDFAAWKIEDIKKPLLEPEIPKSKQLA